MAAAFFELETGAERCIGVVEPTERRLEPADERVGGAFDAGMAVVGGQECSLVREQEDVPGRFGRYRFVHDLIRLGSHPGPATNEAAGQARSPRLGRLLVQATSTP